MSNDEENQAKAAEAAEVTEALTVPDGDDDNKKEEIAGDDDNDDGAGGLPRRFIYLIVFSLTVAVLGTTGLGIVLSIDDVSPTVTLIVGVINAMIGSFLSAAGLVLQVRF